MKISKEEVQYIAKLAKLSFSEEEIDQLSGEFDAILTHFDNLNKVDLENMPVYEFKEKVSVLRKDDMKIFHEKQALFKNVKKMRETYIEIPKIVE
ncbi:MAG: Asp-tRNA(Asn)/Glu-tRNA(Gln) amidotransferase subunit GatC [Clostridia bacterium]|nr:Asp-tRNA(Asn)/Glu-tRNA(Gln) amidotransferase subunit GatC [Clostridia bacterium]